MGIVKDFDTTFDMSMLHLRRTYFDDVQTHFSAKYSTWLGTYPNISMISRDGASGYAYAEMDCTSCFTVVIAVVFLSSIMFLPCYTDSNQLHRPF